MKSTLVPRVWEGMKERSLKTPTEVALFGSGPKASMCVEGGMPPPPRQAGLQQRCGLQFNSVLTPSTWSWRLLLLARAQPFRTASPLQGPVTSPGCVTCTSDLLKLEVPTTPFLGSINMLEQLKELRKLVYSLGSAVY